MFEHLSTSEQALIYRGLLILVKSNSGYGFHNHEQGSPAYAVGRDGTIDYDTFGDSPSSNRLFKMMHELTLVLSKGDEDGSSEIGEWIYCWADFCRLAYAAYEQHKHERS